VVCWPQSSRGGGRNFNCLTIRIVIGVPSSLLVNVGLQNCRSCRKVTSAMGVSCCPCIPGVPLSTYQSFLKPFSDVLVLFCNTSLLCITLKRHKYVSQLAEQLLGRYKRNEKFFCGVMLLQANSKSSFRISASYVVVLSVLFDRSFQWNRFLSKTICVEADFYWESDIVTSEHSLFCWKRSLPIP